MEFVPFFDWVDVPDPKNPPVGAKQIESVDLLRWENGLADARDEINGIPAKLEALEGQVTPASVSANLPTRLGEAELSATIAEQIEATGGSADTLTIQRLDREAVQSARTGTGKATIEYSDATELVEDWVDLTDWVTAGSAQVSGNRFFYKSGGTSTGALKAFTVAAGETAHLSTTIRFVAGGSSPQATYFGIDTDAPGHALNTGSGAFIGWNGSGVKSTFFGGSFGAAKLDELSVGPAPFAGDYRASIDIDLLYITFSLVRLGGAGNDIYTFRVSRETLATAGKTIGNVIFYTDDPRALTGHSFGPLLAVKSLQAGRTKTIAGAIAPDRAEHRHVITKASSGGDNWRYTIPAGYDPRQPAPVVLYHHQSLTGSQNVPWTESRAQPVAEALSDAGFIVAAANDGGDRWGNQASLDNYRALYEHLRDNYSTGPLFLLGVSMGFMPVLNALAFRDLPTPAAVASIGGVADLDTLYLNNSGPYAAGIRSAYGVASDGSDYEAKTAGYNPMDRAGDAFRGVPMRFYTSDGDTAVPRATNADAMSAKVAPFAPEEGVVVGSGGHLDTSQFNPSDLLAFFGRYK